MMHENPQNIENVLRANQVIELMARMTKQLNSGNAQTTIDCRNTYCFKTGQPIGKRDLLALEEALRLHTPEFVEKTLYLSPGSQCHPLWERTDSETLDKLVKIDPRGFAVYCLNLLTSKFHKSPYDAIELKWSCARAWQILGALDQMQLMGLVESLTKCLSFYNPQIPAKNDVFSYICRYAQKQLRKPEDFAILAKSGLLTDIINASINAAINSIIEHNREARKNNRKNEKFIEIPKTPSHLASKAPSQIAGTKAAKRALETAENLMFFGSMFDDELPAPGKEIWRGKLGHIGANEQHDDYDLSDMSFDLDDAASVASTGKTLPKDDGKVIIRTISKQLLAMKQTAHFRPAIKTGQQITPQNPADWEREQFAKRPKVSISDRFAKLKNAPIPTTQPNKPRVSLSRFFKKEEN